MYMAQPFRVFSQGKVDSYENYEQRPKPFTNDGFHTHTHTKRSIWGKKKKREQTKETNIGNIYIIYMPQD